MKETPETRKTQRERSPVETNVYDSRYPNTIRPTTRPGDTHEDDTEGIDPSEVLDALSTSRANIVADIVGHPRGMPSKKELDHTNPSLALSTITEHLHSIEDVSLIESIRVDHAGNARDDLNAFFFLTDEARQLFDRNNLFDEDAYQSVYQEIQMPDEIQSAENADRPSVNATTVTV
ncbi:ArsR family transcriptional regulator [Halobium palmae]|uniref:ArsR family transcriptional regulator n=1 Tax=Halobium palmae TaxID=1776492 RepID=A0ABD5RUK4_9EURY